MASSRKPQATPPQPETLNADAPARVGVHARLTVGAGDVSELERVAYCPARERTVALAVCEACPKFTKLEGEGVGPSVICTPELNEARRKRDALLPNLDLRDVALRIQVAEVMTRFVVCVRPDTPIESVRSILVDTNAPCAPVLTDQGVLAGIVTHAQLLHAGDAKLTAEIMASSVIGIPEDAPLAHAMATMAQAGVLALPVLASDGAVVGAIGALDTLRFIVKRWGYETS